MVGFDFNRLFDESTMYMIQVAEAGINFNELDGLLDVNITDIVSTVTNVTFKAALDYGTALNPIKFQGGVLADFTLTNNTTGLPVTITAVVENPIIAGSYTATVPLTLLTAYTLTVVKTGFTGSQVFIA